MKEFTKSMLLKKFEILAHYYALCVGLAEGRELALDYYAIGGGYLIVERCKTNGGINSVFGHRRNNLRETIKIIDALNYGFFRASQNIKESVHAS